LLCTLARDAALLATPSSSHEVSVVQFLEALLSPDAARAVLDSRPVNVGGTDSPSLRTAFADGRIYFTHFGKAEDSFTMTAFWSWIAMVRGMAWQGYNQQEFIDILIPILMGRNAHLTADNMTGLFIQVKNRVTSRKTIVDTSSFFSPSNPHPYITILMELGSKDNCVVVHPTPERRNKVSAHSCYAFTVHGCTSTSYQVVHPDEEAVYSQVLADRTLLDEHPRQQFRDNVQALKPMWGSSLNVQRTWIED